MQSIQRAFPSIFTDDIHAVRDFYIELFAWSVAFDSDWFVHLQAAESSPIELGILRRDHEIVPAGRRGAPSGGMLTFVVDDVDALHALCVERGFDIEEAPRDLFYGQRRMLVRDPAGTLVDVSSECDPSPAFLESLKG